MAKDSRAAQMRMRFDVLTRATSPFKSGRTFWEIVSPALGEQFPQKLPESSSDPEVAQLRDRLDRIMAGWVLGEHVHSASHELENICETILSSAKISPELADLLEQADKGWGTLIAGNPFNISPLHRPGWLDQKEFPGNGRAR